MVNNDDDDGKQNGIDANTKNRIFTYKPKNVI